MILLIRKMKTSTLSSIFKVYNDKEMASEYKGLYNHDQKVGG